MSPNNSLVSYIVLKTTKLTDVSRN